MYTKSLIMATTLEEKAKKCTARRTGKSEDDYAFQNEHKIPFVNYYILTGYLQELHIQWSKLLL